jgi:outer membrane receptor protein involved in Fe transport
MTFKVLNTMANISFRLFALCAITSTANAQNAATFQPETGNNESDMVVLPEVVVTGYGITQYIQDTAGSVSVINTETIDQTNARQLNDLNVRLPGLSAVKSNTGGDIRLFIRGIGDIFDERNRRVGVTIDGIPQYSPFLQNPSMGLDIERIEVLRGSQSVLYGHGANAGTINIITKKPSKTGGTAQMGFGNEGYRNVLFKYDHVLNENAFVGVAAQWDKAAGFIENVANGKEMAEYDRQDFSLKSTLKPTDKTQIDMRLFANRVREGGPLLVAIDPDSLKPLRYYYSPLMKGDELKFYKIDNDFNSYTKLDTHGLHFNLKQELGGNLTLNWTTGWTATDARRAMDGDGSGVTTAAHMIDNSDNTEFFQGIDLKGRSEALDWIAGVSAYRDRISRHQRRPLLGITANDDSKQIFKGVGVFGQLTWYPTEKFDLTAGFRHQRDKATLDTTPTKRSQSENTTVWRGVATWHFNDNAQIYGSVASGYTPGGFNQSLTMDYYKKETSLTQEAGFKGLWLNNRLYTAAAIFNTNTKDLQLVNPQTYLIGNIGKVRMRGFEFETSFKMTNNWTAGLNFSRLYSEIKKHTDQESIGQRMPYTPYYNVNLNATYTTHTPLGKLSWRTDLIRASRIYADYRNTVSQDAYDLVDTTLSVQSGQHQFQLWVKNLFDKEYYSSVYHMDGAFTMASYAPGRAFGVNYRLSF